MDGSIPPRRRRLPYGRVASRFAPTAVIAMTGFCLALANPSAGQPAGTLPGSVGKGPVGWDSYRQLDQLPALRSGTETRDFDSTDPAQTNADFDHPLRVTADGQYVIAEAYGPGEIVSIWSTINGGNVTDDGTITIQLDGQTVVSANYEDLVSGNYGAPFVWPLVGNLYDTSGGAQIKVPMPYTKSMLVTVQGNPDYFHVIYRQFNDAAGVTTFNPKDTALDVIAKLRAFGMTDPKPPLQGPNSTSAPINIAAGSQAQLVRLNGPAEITQLRLQLPQVLHAPYVVDDGRAFGGGGSSQFTVAINPANQGVTITRRYDPSIGNQVANIYVDGTLAGQWSAGAAVPAGSWADETVTLPSKLTAGKSQITITNEFVSSNLDFNEFRYDISSLFNGEWTRTDTVDVGPDHPGEESAHSYKIVAPTWQGLRNFSYPVDSQTVADSMAVLEGARLQITFDGQKTVDAPIGEFFGSGLGKYDVRTLMFSIDNSSPNGWYTTWWPMPFNQSAVVRIVNSSGVPIQGGKIEVTTGIVPGLPSQLGPNGSVGYFHATFNQTENAVGQDYVFLDTQGRGVFAGLTHTMRGENGNQRGYLEGNERVINDNLLSPAWNGTGTEDFYESGWYFSGGIPYSMPLTGNPAYNPGTEGFANDTTGTYRLFPAEAISFGQRLRFTIQHGPVDDVASNYSSVAFWYGQPTYSTQVTDSVDTTDAASRQKHNYKVSGDTVSSLSSGFPGEFAYVPVTLGVDTASSTISFQLAISPANDGVRLTRISDQNLSYQTANVYINGSLAGMWVEPWNNPDNRFLNDVFEIPVNLTRGQKAMNVQIVPMTGETGTSVWTAAQYEATVLTVPFTDNQSPGVVADLAATGGQYNFITLSWEPAIDSVGVVGYQVYGSQDPSVPVNSGTLVGRTPEPGFQHNGLGLNQKWYYRVVAVDGAGHLGAPSPVVSAVSGKALFIEGQSLVSTATGTAPVVVQGNCCGVTWAGNAQLWFQASAAGQYMVLTVNIPQAGTYDLSAAMTQARDYGIVGLAVDGTPLGQPFDGYHANTVTIDFGVDFGSVALTAGTHKLTWTLTGKNPASINYLVGIDYLVFTLQ
ncbi:MAG: DUF2961 domain-containing protein [Verrucomicrobia bacterium]|nr:DUF2961 domain-containing protein [Verrucomicrobiota bacterium]